MKNLIFSALFLVLPHFAFADCAALMTKYDAPNPASKTMKQIQRWLKKVDNPADAKTLEECMISQAADNPNKAQLAGK
ncbi:hypothetical protein CCY99_03650 [Helicobacter sp. 16-1353]|uniref:hypothetical protein n=1 Tax=Helicobacter sp. 16-1353 TaxID=2004996 RepID=UPI000DCC08A7|nr:hypothetical protein [Helicobacter sp. 16-1353]RAX54454.1 hypothetical protein CCY99_03650 [Helicobacter sp. 16-1353]